MPTNPSPTANLPCEQCGYLNEPERVYCHNCGAKLDRSLLPKTEEKKQETPEKARKRISKMTNPSAGWFWRETKMLFKVAIWSAILAVVLCIIQAPDDVPDPNKKSETMRLVSGDMMEALESPTPRAISFAEDEVNEHLKRLLKAKEGSFGVEFKRAFVKLHPDKLQMNTEWSVWGLPIFPSVDYFLEVKDGKFKATVVGGSIGRLMIDPQAMRYAEMGLDSLYTSLQRERKQMDRMSGVKVAEGRIDLVTKGSAGQ